MDINNLLKGLKCDCGKNHTCNIEYVYVEKDAFKRLKEICKNFDKVIIVADENTFSAAGEQTINNLKDKKIYSVVFSGKTILVPDEIAVKKVTENLRDAQVIIAIGSGVIQDLCKYVSAKKNIPYLVIATAPSMDGYASDGAAMILGGMKETVKSGLPKAVLADVDVLRNAPMDMIKAGYGDVIGKFSALNDWKLSHLITNEYFCQDIYDMTYAQIDKVVALSSGILTRNADSISSLMQALIIIGILMSFAGSSRPASGSEHHLSHFFEITGILDNTAYLSHGLDVAYSTFLTAQIREQLVKSSFEEINNLPNEEKRNKLLKRIYGKITESCIALHNKSGFYKITASDYKKKEEEIKRILKEMPSSKEIKKLLEKVEINLDYFFNFYGAQKIENAKLYAKDLKDRYTVLWIYYNVFN